MPVSIRDLQCYIEAFTLIKWGNDKAAVKALIPACPKYHKDINEEELWASSEVTVLKRIAKEIYRKE